MRKSEKFWISLQNFRDENSEEVQPILTKLLGGGHFSTSFCKI